MTRNMVNTISISDLVRNLSSAIDTVRVTGTALYVTKGAKTVACLEPPPKRGISACELADILESLPKLKKDSHNFAVDIRSIRNRTALPGNPWES